MKKQEILKNCLKTKITGDIYLHHLLYNKGNGIVNVDKLVKRANQSIEEIMCNRGEK